LSQVLHLIEKQIIKSLKENSNQTAEKLTESTKLSIDQIRRGMEWLKLKGLAEIQETEKITLKLGKNGLEAKNNGLPERKIVNEIKDNPKSFDEIRNILKSEFNAGIANAKKNNWIQIESKDGKNTISVKGDTSVSAEEKLIEFIGEHEKLKNEIQDLEALSSKS